MKIYSPLNHPKQNSENKPNQNFWCLWSLAFFLFSALFFVGRIDHGAVKWDSHFGCWKLIFIFFFWKNFYLLFWRAPSFNEVRVQIPCCVDTFNNFFTNSHSCEKFREYLCLFGFTWCEMVVSSFFLWVHFIIYTECRIIIIISCLIKFKFGKLILLKVFWRFIFCCICLTLNAHTSYCGILKKSFCIKICFALCTCIWSFWGRKQNVMQAILF